MSILSKLFAGSGQKDKSYVRAWAEKRQYELGHSDDLSFENLFAVMMYGLSIFGKNDPRRKTPSEIKEFWIDVSEQFSGDATLFELGCYMCFCIDLWLFQNEPNRREEISTTFVRKFVDLFTQALGTKEIATLLKQRLSGFTQLARTETDSERYHYHLSQLILRTKDNQHPETYDFDNAPLMLTGLSEDMGIKFELSSWEQAMLPAIVETLKNYCDLTE